MARKTIGVTTDHFILCDGVRHAFRDRRTGVIDNRLLRKCVCTKNLEPAKPVAVKV